MLALSCYSLLLQLASQWLTIGAGETSLYLQREIGLSAALGAIQTYCLKASPQMSSAAVLTCHRINNSNNNDNIYICFANISGSGMCDASQLRPDRLVLSITSVVLQLELLDIRQHNIITGLLVVSYMHATVSACQA